MALKTTAIQVNLAECNALSACYVVPVFIYWDKRGIRLCQAVYYLKSLIIARQSRRLQYNRTSKEQASVAMHSCTAAIVMAEWFLNDKQ